MAATLPYTYFQCPCTSDTSAPFRKAGEPVRSGGEVEAEDERNFDPRAPRSNYSLYPLEYLLYCEDCQQIRCPRCVLDEIMIWYCPNCLFETPSSTVKSEGNRCTRSCFQCPICISPLSVSNLESSSAAGPLPGSEQTAQGGPWVLSCGCCNWSSTEIGIKFEKPNSIHSQLVRMKNGGGIIITPKERRDREEGRRNIATSTIIEEEEEESKAEADDDTNIENRFAKLKQFYQSQLAETSSSSSLNFSGEYGYGSPGALSRIMGLYTGGSFSGKKAKAKTGLMREARDASEGLVVYKSSDSDVKQLQEAGWAGTASKEQRDNQPNSPRFISELRPVPYLLRTKRSKRCRTCRHILSKPEAKVQITRFRIRLVAGNYIPSMIIKPLSPPAPPAITTTTGTTTAPAPSASPAPLLTPLKPTQFLLTVKNPLFDPIKITLATPSHTPGRFSSKITILCPQFEVGANTDVWDEALQDGSAEREKKRMTRDLGDGSGQNHGQGQAEAGKVWEKGRNWVSVVVEVVPASLLIERGLAALKQGADASIAGDEKVVERGIGEDEDILEIPVFVRVEWETDPANDDAATTTAKEKEVKEKRELAYWCVLGVGRIAQV